MSNYVKIFFFILYIIIIPVKNLFGSSTSEFKDIRFVYSQGKWQDAKKRITDFYKKYPKSNYIPDLYIIESDMENDPEKIISKLNLVLRIFKYFDKKDYVYLKICQVYSLLGQWKNVEVTSQKALKTFPKSKYQKTFKIFLGRSYLQMQEYEKSEAAFKYCSGYDIEHSFSIYKNYGDIKQFHTTLYKESKNNYTNKKNDVKSLYLYAQDQEKRKKYSNAYSAYKDVIKKYPRSIESLLAAKQIKLIQNKRPVYILNYFKFKKNQSEFPDIAPTMEVNGEKTNSRIFYSISVGPFYNLKTALKIKKNVLNEFPNTFIMKRRKDFVLYVGETNNKREANSFRIRLAEEYGIKGKIISLRKDHNKKYIYK